MVNLTENRRYLITVVYSLYLLSALCGAPAISAGESWYPSKYGATDRLGAINNLSPALVKKAAALIKSGTGIFTRNGYRAGYPRVWLPELPVTDQIDS